MAPLAHTVSRQNRSMKKNNKGTLVVKGLFSAAFLTILFCFVLRNENHLLQVFSRVNWLYVTLSFLLAPVMLYTSSLKWKILLRNQGGDVSLLTLFRIYLIGYYFSNLLPSTFGGDVVRSFYVGREINNQSYAAVSIFIERFSGLVFLFFLIIFAPLFKIDLYQSFYISVPAVLGVLFLLGVFWFLKVKDPLQVPDRIICWGMDRWCMINDSLGFTLGRKVQKFFETLYAKIHKKFEKFHLDLEQAFVSIRQNSVLLLQIIGLTILFYLLTWINVYITFQAFGTKIPFWEVCAIVSTVLFVGQIPVSLLANVGFFESVFVVYFLLVGVPDAETLAMALLLRLKMLTLGGTGFIVYLFYRHEKGSELQELQQFAAKTDE